MLLVPCLIYALATTVQEWLRDGTAQTAAAQLMPALLAEVIGVLALIVPTATQARSPTWLRSTSG